MATDAEIFGGSPNVAVSDVKEFDKENPYVSRVRKAKGAAKEFLENQKKYANEARNYYDLDQWSDADKRKMQTGVFERPALTFDMTRPVIDCISGIERLNRQDIRAVSRAVDSPIEEDAAGDLATVAVSTVLDISFGEAERSRAIKDATIGGIGFTEAYTDYTFTTDPDGMVGLRYVDYEEMGWDQHSSRENLEDATCIWRDRWVPKAEFKERWPDMLGVLQTDTPIAEHDSKYRLVTPYYSKANEAANAKPSDETKPKGAVLVSQFQWRELEPLYRIADPENPDELKSFRKLEWDDYKAELEESGQPVPKFVRQQTPVFKQVYVSGDKCLDEPIELPKGFTFMAITGLWHKKKRFWYGLMRAMIEPQNVINKSLSSSLQYHLSNAKLGVMFETGAFENPSQAKNDWAKADAWIPLQQGGAQKIVQRDSKPIPNELGVFFEAGKRAIHEGTGINAEMLGYAQGETPSNTGKQRVHAGLAVLGWLFDNITRYQKTEFRCLLEMIREFWSNGQLLQVGGDFNSQAIPLLRDNLPMDYMLVAEESMRHSPNAKAQIWQDLQPIIPSLLRFGMGQFLLYILRFSPLPTQLVNMIQREAKQNPPPPKPQKGGGKQEPPEMTAAKVQKVGADTELVKAKTENVRADKGLKTAKIVLEGLDNAHTHEHNKELAQHRHISDILKQVRARKTGGPGGQETQ